MQELLSDSGIGREMHVIVGQGQLDAVLQSKPEDRRAYIEEAAGVLKHRKRKEKALRKLDAMQANLTRLTDLTGELRRQLKPLGRQAEIARRAQAVQSELRDARLRLAADDLVSLRDEIAREEADESAARTRRAETEEQLSVARVQQEDLETALAEDAPRLAAAQDTWYRLSALAERLAGTVRLAQERRRHLADPVESRTPGRDPDELEAEADAVAEEEELLVEAVVEARRGTRRRDGGARRARAHPRRRRARAHRRRAGAGRPQGRPRDPRRQGRGAAQRRRRHRRRDRPALRVARRGPGTRRGRARRAGGGPRRAGRDRRGRSGARQAVRAAPGRRSRPARARVAELVARERELEQQRAHWRARVDALSIGLARKDGSAALTDTEGVLGSLSGLITVEPDARTAVAAALGELADALAVAGLDGARSSLELLRVEGRRTRRPARRA